MTFFFVWLFIGAIGYITYRFISRQQRKRELHEIVKKRQNERETCKDSIIISSMLIDSVRREQIATWTFKQLKDNLQSGDVSCIEVLRTYQWMAIKAHEKTNCIAMFIKEAEKWALDLDNKAREKSFVKPAFFGIPISLKECVPIEGYDQTRGYVQHVDSPTKVDCVLVQKIKNLGMIPFVQTNVPQSLLSYCCSNPIYGTTSHPLDKTRTPGGSSGGEAAIIAAGGSIIGIGGDVGGSIRIPCHFTGIAGIKPSHLRFSHRGVYGSIPGRPLIDSSDGPMTKDIETTVEFLREVWRDDWIYNQDPYVPPVVWNENLYLKGTTYRIGYYVDDGWFTPIPAIQRAVMESKSHLEAAGHILVPFHPPSIHKIIRYFLGAVSVDGGEFLLNKLFNDTIDPLLYSMVLLFMVPIRLQRLLAYPVKYIFPRLANIMHSMALSTGELREIYAKIEDYRHEFVMLMKSDNLDAILCPPQAMTAPKHYVPSRVLASCSYTALFNLIDFAAGVVNVTNVTEEDEQKMIDEYPETDPWYRIVKETCKDSVGYPVGVQVACPPYKEEAVLRILRDIEIAVKGDV